MADQPKKPPQKQRSDRKTSRSCDTPNEEVPSKTILNTIIQPFVKLRQRNSKSEVRTAVDRSANKCVEEEDQDDMKTPPIKDNSPPSSHSQAVTTNTTNEYSQEQVQKKPQPHKKRPMERKARSCESAKPPVEAPNRQRFPRFTIPDYPAMKSRNSPERAKSENAEPRKKSSTLDRDKTVVNREFPPKKMIFKKPTMEKSDSNSTDSGSISVRKTREKKMNQSEETSENSSKKTPKNSKRTEVVTAVDRTPAKWWNSELEGTTTPPQRESPPSSANSLSGLPVTPNSSNEPLFTQDQLVAIKNFARQCRQTVLSQFNRSFVELPTPKQYECQAYKENRNQKKNRYPDVLCLDSSRVVLRTMNRAITGDYIHANKLQYPTITAPCIITQGPLEATCADFWRMIWQENTESIFMLCRHEEEGRIKCEEYFHRCGSLEPWQITLEQRPALYSTSYDGIISITPLKQHTEDGIIITELKIYVGNKARRVSHYQCTRWSDFSAPGSSGSDSAMIFKLMNRMSEVKKAHNSIVVHCSAGIGRSGTLVALHMLWADFKEGNPLDVNKVIRILRSARCQSVQTFQQYLFIHKFLLQMGQKWKLLNSADVEEFYHMYDDFAKKNSK